MVKQLLCTSHEYEEQSFDLSKWSGIVLNSVSQMCRFPSASDGHEDIFPLGNGAEHSSTPARPSHRWSSEGPRPGLQESCRRLNELEKA